MEQQASNVRTGSVIVASAAIVVSLAIIIVVASFVYIVSPLKVPYRNNTTAMRYEVKSGRLRLGSNVHSLSDEWGKPVSVRVHEHEGQELVVCVFTSMESRISVSYLNDSLVACRYIDLVDATNDEWLLLDEELYSKHFEDISFPADLRPSN